MGPDPAGLEPRSPRGSGRLVKKRVVDLEAGDRPDHNAEIGMVMALVVAVDRAGGVLQFTQPEYDAIRARLKAKGLGLDLSVRNGLVQLALTPYADVPV